ncbi:MAG: hypothetical protein F6K31_15980 [Symploca sp. SIO2G7]|nr:hypothetical protein [Symploca sp. SIO2G7]
MAKLILVNVDILPSGTCPNTVNTGYKFFGSPVGSTQYSVPKGPLFTFPGGGAQSIVYHTGCKLFLYIDGIIASMGNGIIAPVPTAPGQLKTYNNFCNYGTFSVKYRVI